VPAASVARRAGVSAEIAMGGSLIAQVIRGAAAQQQIRRPARDRQCRIAEMYGPEAST